MKPSTAIVSVALMISLSSCHGLDRLLPNTNSTPATAQSLPDDYTVSGVTRIDREMIQPIRVEGSAITARVKREGEDWYTCNKYEIQLDTKGTGGGGVGFRNQVVVNGDGTFTLNQKPVAPKGTLYEIRSVRM